MSASDVCFGVEIGGTKLQVFAVDVTGRILDRRRTTVPADGSAPEIRSHIVAEISALQAHHKPVAIGVGFGGPIDWRTGVVARSFQVDGWTGFPLADWLSSELGGVPVCVDNDANAAALAEAMYGAGAGCSPMLYSNSGSGVGAGLVIDGTLYRGKPPGEMELGHLRLSVDGHTVQERASGWSLDEKIRAHARAQPSGLLGSLVMARPKTGGEAQVLAQACASQDPSAESILDETARDYAHGLSHAVHLLHPEIIVLGGGVSLLAEPWRQAVSRHLTNFLMDAFRPGPPVVISALGESAVPLGAAALAFRLSSRNGYSAGTISSLGTWLERYTEAQCRIIKALKPETLEPIVSILSEANRANRQIFVCGNGGNASNASHFVTDMGKNASEAMPLPFRVLSINDNASWLTAIGNDYAYEDIFVRQLANYAKSGDVLFVSSVSGNSPNLLRALEWCQTKGITTVALVGAKGGRAAELATHKVVIEDTHYGRVEDTQMMIFHILCYAFVEKVATGAGVKRTAE